MNTVPSGEPQDNGKLLRVVADTNVFVSALQFGGSAEHLWLLAQAGLFTLYVSVAILEELSGVLALKFRWSQSMIREAMSEIRDHTQIVTPREPLAVIIDDPDDDRILECAVAASAHIIVSGDQHLRKLRIFRNIAIMSLTDFLDSRPWEQHAGEP